jgi:hypothetical protein
MNTDIERRALAARDTPLAFIDLRKIVKGFPRGIPTTEAAMINADFLAFILKSKAASA